MSTAHTQDKTPSSSSSHYHLNWSWWNGPLNLWRKKAILFIMYIFLLFNLTFNDLTNRPSPSPPPPLTLMFKIPQDTYQKTRTCFSVHFTSQHHQQPLKNILNEPSQSQVIVFLYFGDCDCDSGDWWLDLTQINYFTESFFFFCWVCCDCETMQLYEPSNKFE